MVKVGTKLSGAAKDIRPSAQIPPERIFFHKALTGKDGPSLEQKELRVQLPGSETHISIVYFADRLDSSSTGPQILVEDAVFSVQVGVSIHCNSLGNKLFHIGSILQRDLNVLELNVTQQNLEGLDGAFELARPKFLINMGGSPLYVELSVVTSNVNPKGGKVAIVFPVTSATVSLVLSTLNDPGRRFVPTQDLQSVPEESRRSGNILAGRSGIGDGLIAWIESTARNLENTLMQIIGGSIPTNKQLILRVGRYEIPQERKKPEAITH